MKAILLPLLHGLAGVCAYAAVHHGRKLERNHPGPARATLLEKEGKRGCRRGIWDAEAGGAS